MEGKEEAGAADQIIGAQVPGDSFRTYGPTYRASASRFGVGYLLQRLSPLSLQMCQPSESITSSRLFR